MRLSTQRELSLTQLTYFVAAAEHGSMTAAAQELFIAQSAISTSIANLESTLGVRLMIRRRAKGLDLTAAGSELLVRARLILAAVDDAVAAMHPESVVGRLSVGCFRTLSPFYLPSIVQALSDAQPELHIDVVELTVDQVAGLLENHVIEIALTYDLGLGPEVRREVLATVPLYVAVSGQHPLAKRESVSLAELVDEPLVLLDMPVSRDYFQQAFADHGLRPRIRYRFSHFEAVRAMVASGHGYTLLNQRPSANLTYLGTELHHLRIEEDTQPLDLVLAWSTDSDRPTRKAELFAEHCRNVVSGARAASISHA